MYKFNGGQGAIICNICRVIILEPAGLKTDVRDFHLCDNCKPSWYNKLYMEDIHDIALKATETIERAFKSKNIELDSDIVDDIYNAISDKIEDYTWSEYRHHL
jgi:hypothetical protein